MAKWIKPQTEAAEINEATVLLLLITARSRKFENWGSWWLAQTTKLWTYSSHSSTFVINSFCLSLSLAHTFLLRLQHRQAANWNNAVLRGAALAAVPLRSISTRPGVGWSSKHNLLSCSHILCAKISWLGFLAIDDIPVGFRQQVLSCFELSQAGEGTFFAEHNLNNSNVNKTQKMFLEVLDNSKQMLQRWHHWVAGLLVASPNSSSRKRIRPRLSFFHD